MVSKDVLFCVTAVTILEDAYLLPCFFFFFFGCRNLAKRKVVARFTGLSVGLSGAEDYRLSRAYDAGGC